MSLADLAGVDPGLAQTMRLLQGMVDTHAREVGRAAEGGPAAATLAKLRGEVESMVRHPPPTPTPPPSRCIRGASAGGGEWVPGGGLCWGEGVLGALGYWRAAA